MIKKKKKKLLLMLLGVIVKIYMYNEIWWLFKNSFLTSYRKKDLLQKQKKTFSAINNSRQSLIKEKVFWVAVKELIIDSLWKTTAILQMNKILNFFITNAKVDEFTLFHAQPFSETEICNIISILGKSFKESSLALYD